MIIGVLSDTHGRADVAQHAVRTLLQHGAKQLVHCGDVGGTDVLDALAGTPSIFVFGNNDYDRTDLEKYAGSIGVDCGGTNGQIDLDGKKAVVTHGDDSRLISRLIREQQIDYLFLGHTHQRLDQMQGRVRVINPGALYRAAIKTVALLDTQSNALKFITIA